MWFLAVSTIQFTDHHEIEEVHDWIDQVFVQLLADMKRF